MTNIFLSVFEISVSVSILIAVLLLLTPLLNKRYAAKWKYWIWIILALRLVVPFSGTDVRSMANTLLQANSQTTLDLDKSNMDDLPEQAPPQGRVVVEIPAQMTTPIAQPSEKSSINVTPLDVAAFVWAVGSLVFISLNLISYARYRRHVLKRGEVIRDSRILCQMFRLKHELGIKDTLQVIEYSEAASPMMIGFIEPVLILPEEPANSEELYFILKHELVHLKRKDVYMKLLLTAANAVHWFNPLVWIMQKEASVDMELSCDERVTQGTDYAARKAYTETLLSTLHKRCARRTVLSTQFYGGKQIMKKRFKNILIKTGKKNGAAILMCAILLTASLGTLVGCSVAASGQIGNGNVERVFGQSGSGNGIGVSSQSEMEDQNSDSLSESDIIGFNTGFFNSEADIMNNMLLTSEYNTPDEIDLFQLFYHGLGGTADQVSEEELNLLTELFSEAPYLDVFKIEAGKMDAFLRERLGIGLEETQKTGLDNFYYLEEYDSYYVVVGDTNYAWCTVLSGIRESDDRIRLDYIKEDEEGQWRVTLQKVGNGYLFVSNVKVD